MITDARIKELVYNAMYGGSECPDVSLSECIEFAIRKGIEESAAPEALRNDEALTVLRELVALKDLRDGFGVEPFGDHNSQKMRDWYKIRKPVAWAAARSLVSPLARYRGTVKFDDETREITGEFPTE